MNSDKIKQFTEDILDKYKYDRTNETVKLCNMLIDAIEAINRIENKKTNYYYQRNGHFCDFRSELDSSIAISKAIISKLEGWIE